MPTFARSDWWCKLWGYVVASARPSYPRDNTLCLPRATLFTGWVLAVSAASLWCSRKAAAAEDAAAGLAPVVTVEEQPDFTFDVRLHGGGAALALTQSLDSEPYGERHVGDPGAATLGAGLQWGWFAGSQLQLGLVHSIERYEWIGQSEVIDVSEYEPGYWTEEGGYTVFSPLGVFLEIHGGGVFLNVSGSLGYIPSVAGQGGTFWMAGFALEAGHELGPTKDGLGLFLRYASWVGTESPLYTDFPAGVTSHELNLGVRWSFGR
jgi:hypothetical protein